MERDMTKDEILREKQSQMTNNELVELAGKEISQLCKTGGRSIRMCVPPMITDTDMVLSETVKRFQAQQSEIEALKAEFAKYKHDEAGRLQEEYSKGLTESLPLVEELNKCKAENEKLKEIVNDKDESYTYHNEIIQVQINVLEELMYEQAITFSHIKFKIEELEKLKR